VTALTLAGVYLLVALGSGGDPDGSETFAPIGGGDVPVTAAPGGTPSSAASEPAAASTPSAAAAQPQARATPRAEKKASPPASAAKRSGDETFSVVLPAGWRQHPAPEGDIAFRPASARASVLAIVQPDTGAGPDLLAVGAATYLARRPQPGAVVSRIEPRPLGDMQAVARAVGPTETRTAYVAIARGRAYMLIASRREKATAAERRQAEDVVRSFRAR
jgi:hypothetical protein